MKKSLNLVLERCAADTAIQPRPVRTIKGETLVFAAEEEIRLVCGKSSITLSKSGRVILKGVEIVSRGTRTNKIKGGSVSIN